jgi:hypothetical protein
MTAVSAIGIALLTTNISLCGIDERVFSCPNEFLPERWTTQPELVKDSSAFIPFNGGMSYYHFLVMYSSCVSHVLVTELVILTSMTL